MSSTRGPIAALALCLLASGCSPLTARAEEGANAIYNSRFGQGLLGWRKVVQAQGGEHGYPRIKVSRERSGALARCDRSQGRKPYLSIAVPAGAAGYVQQEVIVPVHPGRLTFRAWGQLEPVKVRVSVTSGPRVKALLSFEPPPLLATAGTCSGAKPVTESLDVDRLAGQAVGLRIRATSPGLVGAVADFDDFHLRVR